MKKTLVQHYTHSCEESLASDPDPKRQIALRVAQDLKSAQSCVANSLTQIFLAFELSSDEIKQIRNKCENDDPEVLAQNLCIEALNRPQNSELAYDESKVRAKIIEALEDLELPRISNSFKQKTLERRIKT